MRNLRIVFMGTPEFAVESLKKLVENNYTIAGVITAPDKPAGRGRSIRQSAVKQYAVSQNLKVLQPTNLKDEQFLAELRSLNANLQVVVAFRMLPRAVWQMPEYGTFNLHASLLPDYRGAAPINHAIINGESVTGVTTFFIDDKIDTGEIILREKEDILPDDNAGSLHDKLMKTGAELVLTTVRQIETGHVATRKQEEVSDPKTASKIDKDTCRIDWNKGIAEIYNHIRGLSPYPGAWTTLFNNDKETQVKIYGTEKEKVSHNEPTGNIVTAKGEVKVAASDGFIKLKEIQLPGKRKMNIVDVLNGYTFHPGARVS
ncbi:methionyl-tRNA formyltransferase [Sinomicrobium weinanense]|uniref:Methionyl-tRNA formyltransferase n=1 Tax=Sinomicrobium weinanense TaxID=2842200 RepID=A0A926JRX4_9FLAO|nr:methionyl-tRNA formyltransferase [Sinomicrobium weinanense]MBC9796249.1 methionyl-tRNA formyltransferase [Sinomicrobium weinanense]MBU3122296.1 methionyl-tRNA formyltransferase [Sinomicrobium weinanense]